ncbi:hypothetical protein JDV02_002831 [Purpureocillium takamizusanense]|uniref:Mid2 domain-containing protein n=1 Tax=Purpureocillium takamizusanense TaxID=2060973 RepID=A0A9Q8QCG2_9HYPO|nr:uncharacterized protein JDV02_002831 [Purpureocillium takamizusanense]UNI16396.1 hypothetical protein JDV02_002831 [Purpureocillium takamizusanense]
MACQCRDQKFTAFMPCCLFDACSSRELDVVPAKVDRACKEAGVNLDMTDKDWQCMPSLDESTASVPRIPSLVLPTRSMLKSELSADLGSTTASKTETTATVTTVNTTTTAMTTAMAAATKQTATKAPSLTSTNSGSVATPASPTSTTERNQTPDNDSALAIGLGVGLGVGVPVLIALVGLAHILRLIKQQSRDGGTAGALLYGSGKGRGDAAATKTEAAHGPGELHGNSTHKQELAGTLPVGYAELP